MPPSPLSCRALQNRGLGAVRQHDLVDPERLAHSIELTRFPVPADEDHAETGTEAGLMAWGAAKSRGSLRAVMVRLGAGTSTLKAA